MADQDELDEDLFADLYEGDDNAPPAQSAAPAAPAAAPAPQATVAQPANQAAPEQPTQPVVDSYFKPESQIKSEPEEQVYGENIYGTDSSNSYQQQRQGNHEYQAPPNEHGFTGTVGIKEDGKMFIGGLNWETTDQSLRDYFSQFGEVTECSVMRDGATGRSRGFGFLTFKDPKTVNTVMVKEHHLDNKIIDPKRAIPREDQEKTSKIFVGGVSSEATERDFESYFAQFGRVIDATLMMDKDTGRPRGFGFVTFEGEAAVDACLAQPLVIMGKPIEVKRAQPRGNGRDEDDGGFNGGGGGRGGRGGFGRGRGGGGGYNDRGRDDRNVHDGGNMDQQNGGGQAGMTNGMSPQMMAQYWQRMQQYFAMMQQQMAANMGGGGGPQGMGGMNPQMMQQMMAMQQMQQGGRASSGTPGADGQNMMNGMNPQMMQQMQQMQQMQMQQQQQVQQQDGGMSNVGNMNANMNNGGMNQGNRMVSPMPSGPRNNGNAQQQMDFEQRKYEQQQGRRMGSGGPPNGPSGFNNNNNMNNMNNNVGFQGSPQSWDGMYDDVPPPGGGPAGPAGRGHPNRGSGSQGTPQPSVPLGQAPLNAPTGPKNMAKPMGNYRGGGRGGRGGFHPYARGGNGGRGGF